MDMEYQLTTRWKIDLPDGFQHRKEGAHGVFWTSGLTMITTVFNYESDKERQVLLENLRDKALTEGYKTIEDADEDEFLQRFGYLQTDEIQLGHTRLVLHAFTLAPQSCLQTSFYADRPEDFDAGLRAWKSAAYLPVD
ncbi:MAG TPA: hypothetical protein DCG78_01710 [Anaerolineaceae bacterium]|nr:hypothetical protein [Anaerolineaceae bacterium]